MTEASPRPYLRLVRSNARDGEPAPDRLEQVQAPLLLAGNQTLGMCTADALDERLLVSLMENVRPRLILDFRTVPRFDFGSYNRKKAFELFDSVRASYRDVGASVLREEDKAATIAEVILSLGTNAPQEIRFGSVIVVIDAGLDYQKIALATARHLRNSPKLKWDLVLFGPLERDAEAKQVIFISHANPEDNEFALWLQAQLTRLGYETWSDLTELKAGEVFWDTIEDIVRNKATRVIAVVSKASMQKPGVLDEISLAVSVERSKQISGFVIPVRLDDIQYSDFRANIARKNVVDFSGGWTVGLSRVLDGLIKDKVPRHRQAVGLSLASWWAQQKPALLTVLKAPEQLVSNRFRLQQTPSRLYVYTGTPHRSVGTLGGNPYVRYKGHWLSYLSPTELNGLDAAGLSYQSALSAADTFNGNVQLTDHTTLGDRRRLMHSLFNKHWEHFLLTKGFGLYELTGSQPTPFIPDGLVLNNTSHFTDVDGVRKRRLVVGYSTKRSVYWHLAPLGYFTTNIETALNLKMRVLFSEDGHSQWPSADRMRAMRRGFCKNWWNDRWRTLQYALIAFLSDSTERILLHDGEAGQLSLDAKPIAYECAFSIQEQHIDAAEEDASQIPELDDLDDEIVDDAVLNEEAHL